MMTVGDRGEHEAYVVAQREQQQQQQLPVVAPKCLRWVARIAQYGDRVREVAPVVECVAVAAAAVVVVVDAAVLVGETFSVDLGEWRAVRQAKVESTEQQKQKLPEKTMVGVVQPRKSLRRRRRPQHEVPDRYARRWLVKWATTSDQRCRVAT